MKKITLLAATGAALICSALPLTALTPGNHNALGKSPVMGSFSTPPTQEQLDKEAKVKEASLSEKRKAPSVKPENGTPLPRIIASVYDYESNTIGMYLLPEVSGGEMTKLSDVSSYYGGSDFGNLFYACHDGRYEDYWDTDYDPHGHRIQAYDKETWQPVGNEVTFPDYRSSDLAINPSTGLGYAFCDYGSMMYHLYELNLQDGSYTDLSGNLTIMPEESSRALAFNAEGVLYGVTRDGKFGAIDMTTGKNASTFDLGISPGDSRHGWTAAFNPEDGNLLFFYNGNNATTGDVEKSILYSVNPANGEIHPLAEFEGKCITSMFISEIPVADNAPGQVSDASLSFTDGNLSGKVSFTMPTKLHDGSAASGTMEWAVSADGSQLAAGSAEAGAAVSADVTLPAAGKHTFSICASNAAGTGKVSRISSWVGPDIPKAPANVKVKFTEEKNLFEVSWDAVTEGANGGYVDPSAVRYTVTRNPGNVVVTENSSLLSLSETYAPSGIESITYSVTALQGDAASEAGVSNAVVTGTLSLPYEMKVYADGNYHYSRDWSVIDANGDDNTWKDDYQKVRYSYSTDVAADDWLISPPIQGYAGCKYKVTLTASAYGFSYPSSSPERLEVKMGDGASVKDMTKTLVEPTDIDQIPSEPRVIEFDAVPDKDGRFFIGIHAVSDANMWHLDIHNVTISAPVSEDAPAAVTDLTVTADPSGALKATGSGKAPALTSKGNRLPSISKIEILRDGSTVATVEDVTPGATFTFEDNEFAEAGLASYTAVAYNGDLAGDICEPVAAFIGFNTPGEVTGLTISETENEGEVKVSWEAPLTDSDGFPAKGSHTYTVEVFPDNAYYHGNITYGDIEGTEFTFKPTFKDDRDHGFVYVKVRAVNEAGTGFYAESENIPVGKCCALPFGESFPNYTLEHPWGDGESNGPHIGSITDDERAIALQQFNGWNRMMDRSFNSSEGSQDGDNGFAGMFGWSFVEDEEGNMHNEWNELLSPKISLEGSTHPVLTFYTYNWLNENGKDFNELSIEVVCDGKREQARNIIIGDLGETQGWEFVAVDLSAYAGKTISLIFKGTVKSHEDMGYNWILIDNLDITSTPDTDLAIDGFSAPVQAKPGEEFTLKARVTNVGSKDVTGAKAILLKNGETVAEQELPALAFSSSRMISFTQALTVNDPIGNKFSIRLSAPGDENADNDETETLTVGRNLQLLPEPRNPRLTEGHTFEWDAPDMTLLDPAPFTDDFESYGDTEATGLFSTEAGEWVLVDVDQAPIGGIISASTQQMIELPGIPTHSKQSWWVQSRLCEDFNNDYFGYSGLQYLANMYVVNDEFNRAVQQDDWAISPLLCGKEQMISLMARSYDRYTPETIEFYWSDGSTDPADFTLIQRHEAISGDWTQYVFVVPEGARRFAIRGCSYAEYGTNQTFIDDVTFVPAAGDPLQLTLTGYNVYNGNTLLNAKPINALKSVLEDFSDKNSYSVSAVYDKGESRAVKLDTSGIGSVAPGSLTIRAMKGKVLISGLDNGRYDIVSTSGIIVACGTASGSVSIDLPAGTYIVKTAEKTCKVIVK